MILLKVFKNIVMIIPLVVFSIFIFKGINYPFVGPNATSLNIFSLIAKNYIKFGYINTQLAPIASVITNLDNNMIYYLHHPQLLPLILSLFYKYLGENFWVGRFVGVLPSVGSLILIYLLAKSIFNKKIAFFSSIIASITPANSIFGRMITQEPLSQFFILLNLYLLINYLKYYQIKYFIFMLIFSMLGTLTDWQMIFYSFLISILFLYKKKRLQAILIFSISFATEILFLIYSSNFIQIPELIKIIRNRSLGLQLTSLSYWPIRWFLTIFIRYFIYFNPVFIYFSFKFIKIIIKKIRTKKILDNNNFALISLFLVGIVNIIFFPEGSFSHAYWIYYLVPFVSLSVGYVLSKIWLKNKLSVILIIIFSFIYCLFINNLKLQQIKNNIWRYEMAKEANKYLTPYENILVNTGWVIDADMLGYQFSLPVTVDEKLADITDYKKYLYSCSKKCNNSEIRLWELLKSHDYILMHSSQAEVYLIDLNKITKNPQMNKEIFIYDGINNNKYDYYKKLYYYIKYLLKIPQL